MLQFAKALSPTLQHNTKISSTWVVTDVYFTWYCGCLPFTMMRWVSVLAASVRTSIFTRIPPLLQIPTVYMSLLSDFKKKSASSFSEQLFISFILFLPSSFLSPSSPQSLYSCFKPHLLSFAFLLSFLQLIWYLPWESVGRNSEYSLKEHAMSSHREPSF